MYQMSFFDESKRLEKISRLGDNLEKLKEVIKIYADSAYSGEDIASRIPKCIENKIIEKGYRNKPLTKAQEKKNRTKSKTRYSQKNKTNIGILYS